MKSLRTPLPWYYFFNCNTSLCNHNLRAFPTLANILIRIGSAFFNRSVLYPLTSFLEALLPSPYSSPCLEMLMLWGLSWNSHRPHPQPGLSPQSPQRFCSTTSSSIFLTLWMFINLSPTARLRFFRTGNTVDHHTWLMAGVSKRTISEQVKEKLGSRWGRRRKLETPRILMVGIVVKRKRLWSKPLGSDLSPVVFQLCGLGNGPAQLRTAWGVTELMYVKHCF